MIIQLGKYRNGLALIKSILERNPHRQPHDLIEEMSIASSIPIIAVAHFVGELTGFSEELNYKIDVLMKFYNYEGVEE